MPGDDGEVTVERVAATRRFEARRGGATVGYMTYADAADGGGVLDLLHTVVAPAARAQGIGETLVREALARLRADGARIVPSCPFVAEYLAEHPEDRDLVAAG